MESVGRFLVNNILFDSVCSMIMAQIQFSLIKKIKIGCPEHSLTPYPQCLITSHFCLTPHPPPPHHTHTHMPQSGRHMCMTPNMLTKKILILKNTCSHNRSCCSKLFFNYKLIPRKVPGEEFNLTDITVIHSANLLFWSSSKNFGKNFHNY